MTTVTFKSWKGLNVETEGVTRSVLLNIKMVTPGWRKTWYRTENNFSWFLFTSMTKHRQLGCTTLTTTFCLLTGILPVGELVLFSCDLKNNINECVKLTDTETTREWSVKSINCYRSNLWPPESTDLNFPSIYVTEKLEFRDGTSFPNFKPCILQINVLPFILPLGYWFDLFFYFTQLVLHCFEEWSRQKPVLSIKHRPLHLNLKEVRIEKLFFWIKNRKNKNITDMKKSELSKWR